MTTETAEAAGTALRRRAREASEAHAAQADREREDRRAKGARRPKTALAVAIQTRLGISLDASVIGGHFGSAEGGEPVFYPRVTVDGLTFGWEQNRNGSYYTRLFLCWICPMCRDEITSRGCIDGYFDLNNHIAQVDAWASGVAPCPTCASRAKEAASAATARGHPQETPAPKLSAAEQLRAAIVGIVREEIAMDDINGDGRMETDR